MRGGVPDPGHVPARGRHRRLRQEHLHRLQGHPGPAGRPPTRRRAVRVGHPGRAGSAARHLGASGPDGLVRGRAAVLRRAAPGAVGLAGQRLHLDQVDRSRELRGTGRARLRWRPGLGERRRALGGAGAGAGLPGRHGRPADHRPQAPDALPPDLHPAALAELAGARDVHRGRLRHGRGAVPGGRPDRVRAGPAGPGRRGAAAGRRGGRLHRVPVRPGQSARHVAEPAASPAPGGAGRAGGCRGRGRAAAAGLAGPGSSSGWGSTGPAPTTSTPRSST